MWRSKKSSLFILDGFLLYEWSDNDWRCWKNKWFMLIFFYIQNKIVNICHKFIVITRLLHLLDSFAHNTWCISVQRLNKWSRFISHVLYNKCMYNNKYTMNNDWASKWPSHNSVSKHWSSSITTTHFLAKWLSMVGSYLNFRFETTRIRAFAYLCGLQIFYFIVITSICYMRFIFLLFSMQIRIYLDFGFYFCEIFNTWRKLVIVHPLKCNRYEENRNKPVEFH